MIFVMTFLVFAAVLFLMGLPTIPKRSKKVKSSWGIIELAPLPKNKLPVINSSYEELESWYNTTQTLEAENKKLRAEIVSYESRYSPHLDFKNTLDAQRLRNEVFKLRDRVAELEESNRKDLLALLPNGPAELPDNPWVTTTFHFRGRELTEWEQHMEKESKVLKNVPAYHTINSVGW